MAPSDPPNDATRWLRALRAFSFPLSVMPVWLGTAAALRPAQCHWGVLAACTLMVLALHSAGNLLNDYFDFVCGADRRTLDDDGRPGRLLVCGQMTPREVLAEAMVALAVAALPAVWLLWRMGPALFCFLVPAVLALYAYSGPPLRLKARAVGEVLVLIVFGPLIAAGAAYAQTGELSRAAIIASVPAGMATTAVLASNNLRDYVEDASAGVRTLAHVLKPSGQRLLYVSLVVGLALGAALLPLLELAHPLLMLAALMPAALLLRPSVRRFLHGYRVPDIDAITAQYGTLVMVAELLAVSLR